MTHIRFDRNGMFPDTGIYSLWELLPFDDWGEVVSNIRHENTQWKCRFIINYWRRLDLLVVISPMRKWLEMPRLDFIKQRVTRTLGWK